MPTKMPVRIVLAAAIAGAGIQLAAVTVQERRADPIAGEPHRFLRTVGGFASADLEKLDRGEPLAKVLDTDRREIAIVAAIRIKATRERLLDRYRDVSTLRGSEMVLEVGPFSESPRPEDLDGLHFEDYDLDTIRACKPGNCGVRLSTESMARFTREVDWRAADWRQQAGALWRRLIAGETAAYLTSGAMADYRNKAEPLSVAEEFRILFDESRYFVAAAPDFFGYLQAFPRARLPGAENILYWSKDDFGLRPVTSVTHLILYPGSSGDRRPAAIGTKQIYSTHYFDAGLGLTMAFDDNASGFYMVSINRARTRSLTSFMRGFVRSVVQRRSRDAMEKVMRSTKTALERPAK